MWVQKVPGGGVADLAYSPGGETLYTLDNGGWLTAWDLISRGNRRLAHVEFPTGCPLQIAAMADGRTVATRGAVITFWDARTGRELGRLALPWQNHAQVRPDGRVYYREFGSREIVSWNFQTGKLLTSFDFPEWLSQVVHTFEISPDGRLVCLVIYQGAHPVLYQVGNGTELCNSVNINSSARTYQATFSPDSRLVAVFSKQPDRISLWDVRTRTMRVIGILCDQSHGVFAWNPTAPVFAALNPDHVLTLFSVATGERLRSLDFDLGPSVLSVAFSPDGLTCAVGGSDNQFAVFDVDL
jgi:WD40 repeat protein